MSKPRISYDAFAKIAPIAQSSLIAMGRQADESGIDKTIIELVATWEEAGIFSDKESAALAWAEALAQLAGHSVSDAAYAAVRAHFSEEEVVFLSVSIATINAWNRLGAAFRFAPPIPKKVAAAA